MKLDRAAIVLRPRTVTEVVDLAFRLTFSLGLSVYSKLAAFVLLPILAGIIALRYVAKWDAWLVWFVALGAANLAQGVFTVAAGRLLFSEDLRVREVLGAYFRRVVPYFFTLCINWMALAAVAGASFGIAVPFAWPSLVFTHEASLLEGAGPIAAVQRASRFVRGRGWTTFGLASMLLCGQASAILIGELMAQSVLDDILQLGRPLGSLFRDGVSPFAIAGLLASVPFVATARFLQYIDTRTRTDGWDIQVRFLAIASKDPEERRLAA
ncbi:MAG: hypothetical protein R3B70_34720 [Polyangiaceae bacterium]